jgi:hypothetical protein
MHCSEGSEAISKLNGQKPLHLAVQFAMSEEEKLRRRKIKEEEDSPLPPLPVSNDPPYRMPFIEPPYPR